MNNRDSDDSLFEPATGERRRRPTLKLPKPVIRLILFVVAIVVIVVIVVVSARGCSSGGDAADYNRYMLAVADILEQSDATGAELAQVLTTPGDTNRTGIQTKLDSFISTCEELEVKAQGLNAPKDLLGDSAIHQIFLLVMNFRQQGVSELKPAIMGALEVQDAEVPSEQILNALYYLTTSDFLYAKVFLPRMAEILTQRQLTGILAPSSQFLPDPNLASKTEVLNVLAGLKSTGVLQAVHGVALKKVNAMPDDKEISAGGTFNLTSSDQLAFVVTVENQGNMDEQDVPVTITLTSESAAPQEVTVQIPEIKAKTETDISVEGLNPTPYGEKALIKVKAGPVPEEKYSDNNSLEAYVIFKL
jgi:hypothetical protein